MSKKKNENILKAFSRLGFESEFDRKYIHLQDMLSEEEFESLVEDAIRNGITTEKIKKETNQSKFLKEYPNAVLDNNGIIAIDPCFIDSTFCCEGEHSCDKCAKEFWLKEIEEE